MDSLLLRPVPGGLYCEAGDFYVDPTRAVARAVITHGHSDHARAGHGAVLATRETLAIMAERYGEGFAGTTQALSYGEGVTIGGVSVRLAPAGHVLGSAQAVVEHKGMRIVVSGDYKRRRDPTCAPFEPVPCDIFITEATFGLPVFRHPEDAGEIAKLLHSVRLFPERAHLIVAYSLGKAQRIIALLREAGYAEPIFLHGAMAKLCALYEKLGVPLGALRPVMGAPKGELAGKIILAPPSALGDVWSRRLPDPVACFASGWMRVRARARQRGVELPLILSDHADWDELTGTLRDVGAGEVWVTHGQEDALVHQARKDGFRAKALALVGYGDEGEP
ncbi:MAG: ligase-associated DNA damage response exonuclease [Alphaproteobacteria bacterium]|nr:ligase-associated DNA damage response exonuclease [Alphaproteobacteria bacterium]